MPTPSAFSPIDQSTRRKHQEHLVATTGGTWSPGHLVGTANRDPRRPWLPDLSSVTAERLPLYARDGLDVERWGVVKPPVHNLLHPSHPMDNPPPPSRARCRSPDPLPDLWRGRLCARCRSPVSAEQTAPGVGSPLAQPD